jgi:hypothetical protein
VSLSDADFAELSQITGLSICEWQDVLSEDAADQQQLLDDWRALGRLSWAKQSSALERVIAILGVAAAIAAPVGVVTGGIGGVVGLVAALRGL